MTPQVKLRTLAAANAGMQSRFGTNPMRYFDIQLDQEQVQNGPCLRARRISQVFLHSHDGLNKIDGPLFQFDILDLDPETARAAAYDVIAFLQTVDLSTNAQFGSPVTTPTAHPVIILNQRSGLEPVPDPPVWVESLDVRFINLEA